MTTAVGNSPRAISDGRILYTPACAPVFKDSSKEESLLNGLNDSKTLKTLKTREEVELAAIARQIEARQAAAREAPGPVTIGATLVPAAEAIGEHFAPEAQKQRLVPQFRKLVNDPGTTDWLFGYAADLLIVYGQSSREDAAVIYGRMTAIIQELRQIREVQTRRGQVHGPRGAWFNRRVIAIARDHGIKLPGELKAERLAAAHQTH